MCPQTDIDRGGNERLRVESDRKMRDGHSGPKYSRQQSDANESASGECFLAHRCAINYNRDDK